MKYILILIMIMLAGCNHRDTDALSAKQIISNKCMHHNSLSFKDETMIIENNKVYIEYTFTNAFKVMRLYKVIVNLSDKTINVLSKEDIGTNLPEYMTKGE